VSDDEVAKTQKRVSSDDAVVKPSKTNIVRSDGFALDKVLRLEVQGTPDLELIIEELDREMDT